MKRYIRPDEWQIVEDRFDAGLHPNTESLMSLGNGRMGQRGNFEETYSGKSLQGNYIAGVYYPDKTRVGWWKNGYPEYFAKVLNSVNWIRLHVVVDDEVIDLAKCHIKDYNRRLDMQHGILYRDVSIKTSKGKEVVIRSERFYSIVDQDCCFLRYRVTPESEDIKISITSYLDFNIRNADANYDNDFWTHRQQAIDDDISWVSAHTKKTDFLVAASAKHFVRLGGHPIASTQTSVDQGVISHTYQTQVQSQETLELTKCTAITSSFNYESKDVLTTCLHTSRSYTTDTFETAKAVQAKAWLDRWDQCDIIIEGDMSAQQAIRFNIYQLYQTYSGEDARLNIGPKGFTGEKYGGSTYWDTEAYCLPFYMSTASQAVARNLLIYRHRHLQKAIENAQKLGFTNGAALYPMVTINGEECHNEWEITFEEIHRNGAIAFAIFNYIRYTGDVHYLIECGLEVLIGIARFWAQRVNISPSRDAYVMLGVTGPNEYENNVDNNWYTNYIARWCLQYTHDSIHVAITEYPQEWSALGDRINFELSELTHWADIVGRLYLPEDEALGIFVQHDGYLDKAAVTVADLDKSQRPINQKWSWDRILRSPYIKQADVLQGLYFFEDQFSTEEIRRNFLYYEPRTVHESSLSPCVHSILAASIDMKDKAYEMYLRTARLDLDDYNNDTEDGCHITSMAGTWMSIVEGFAGMRIKDDCLSFSPFRPKQWTGYSFKITWRTALIKVKIHQQVISISNLSDKDIEILIYGSKHHINGGQILNAVLERS